MPAWIIPPLRAFRDPPRSARAKSPRRSRFRERPVHIAPSRDRGATSKCPRRHGGLLFLNAQLNPIVKSPKGGTDAGHNLSQPALQHLAQDIGVAARKRRRAADHRIFEDALYGGAAEAASRPNEDAGKQAVAEEGGGGRRHRPVKAVGRSADRGDGQEPDHRRAADCRLRAARRHSAARRKRCSRCCSRLTGAGLRRCIRRRRTCRPGSARRSGRRLAGSAASTASAKGSESSCGR